MKHPIGNGYINDYARRFMVVVGVNSYEDKSPELPNLETPVADACRIFSLLKDRFDFQGCLLAERDKVRKYEAGHGICGSLEPYLEGDGTRADIEQAIWNLAREARPEDLFLFYYGGHGMEENGMGFLLPYGAVLNRYDTYLMYPAFFGALEALPCLHKLLFFDCCFAGIVTMNLSATGENPESHGSAAQILLAPATASFASTTAFDVAPDRFHVWYDDSADRWSPYSPFGDTLAVMLEQMPCETSLIPAAIQKELFEGVLKRVRTVPTKDGKQVPLQPTVKLVGTATIFLKKRGTRLPDTKATGTHPGQDKSTHGHETEKIRLETKYLPTCYVQRNYRAALEITGGVPTLRVQAERLPRGLDISASGELYGRVEPDVAIGGGHLHVFVLCVTDSKGQILRERLALPVIDPDVYVAIPAGEFQFGYRPSPQRAQTLNHMQIPVQILEGLIQDHPAGTATLPLFFIRRRPLTNFEWKAFVEQTNHPGVPPSWGSTADDEFWHREGAAPVTGLRGRDVEAFCDWRHTCLPSRFEWEKAARGTDGRLFPWGDDFLPYYCTCLEQHRGVYPSDLVRSNPALFVTRADQHPQGKSPYGVEDLIGNTWELTRHVLWDDGHQPYFARMGGSVADGGAHLTACFGCRLKRAVPGTLDANQNSIHLAPGPLPPLTGFRDVIELAQAPPFPQGFVKLTKAALTLGWAPDVFINYDAYLARYQVSNLEYAEFVRDTGHDRPRHWPNDDEWFFPFSLRFHPVVNVTWQDVLAFCHWKTKKLRVHCLPLSRSLWRLAVHQPHAGDGHRPCKYPWGNDYSEGLCNHPPSGYGRTIPVFELPKGRAACGAWNLIGNAAEWVSPTETAGGSWLCGTESPEDFIVPHAQAGPDVGFRYFTWGPMGTQEDGDATSPKDSSETQDL